MRANPEEIPPPGKPREWIKYMDRYLLIELSSTGLAIETAQADFYLSWLGLGFILAGLIAYKLIKRFKRAN